MRFRCDRAMSPQLIIGAGPTGLSAAHHLDAQSVLLEQGPTVGGWCRSIVENGFTFDHAGHIMFSKDPYVHELYGRLLGENVHWQDREAWVYTDGVYTRYPFQSALHGLPPEVLKECLVGAIEARFGSIKDAPVPAAADTPATDKAADCCADGVADIAPRTCAGGPLKSIRAATVPPQNFEEFIHKTWGAGVAKHFAIPYNRKLWALPLSEMETSWLGGRVPLPDLEEMIEGALRPVAKPVGPNARFGYPLRGGFQALMDGFLPLLEGKLRLNAKVERVSPARHEAILADGSSYRYKKLISTVPLPKLISMIGPEAPAEVQAAARGLRHVSVRCVNLGIARTAITDKHWIYYAGSTVFHRIFLQGNASPYCNPEGGFGLTCEITYAPSKPLPCEGEALTELCIADCIRVGILRPEDRIVVKNQVDMPCAYVVYDHARKRNVETHPEMAGAVRHHLGGPLQSMGVLQFRPCIPRRKAGGRESAKQSSCGIECGLGERLTLMSETMELWGGIECTVNRIGDAFHSQLELTGHDRRVQDLEAIASLGIRTLRYPVLWELTEPGAGRPSNWQWPQRQLERLRELGITPIAGLVHHGSGPPHTNLLADDFAPKLAAYAAEVARRFPWLTWYTPVNEPLTTARFSALVCSVVPAYP